MNDWKRILDQLSEDGNEERKFQTTEIKINTKPEKLILGFKPALFWASVSVFSLVLILGLVWIITVASSVSGYDKIYPGVSVLDIDLGGLTYEEAVGRVEQYSDNYYSNKEITLVCLDVSVPIPAKEAIVSVDAQMAAKAAYDYGRDRGFFAKYSLIKSNKKHVLTLEEESGTANETYIRTKVSELAAAVGSEYIEYSVVIGEESVDITRGQDGISINESDVVNRVLLMLAENNFGEIPVDPIVQKTSVPDIAQIKSSVYIESRDARLVKTSAKEYSVEEEVVGQDIDTALIEADFKRTDWDKNTYPIVKSSPITKAELEKKLFADVLGQFSTKINLTELDRSTNVRLAALAVNGTVLLPGSLSPAGETVAGETFSFNSSLGERTAGKGYKSIAPSPSGEIGDTVGGGVSQVASTLYTAALLADLNITQRTGHIYAPDYIQLGQDAAVQYGKTDLAFVNNSGFPVKIEARLSANTLTLTIRGTNESGKKVVLEPVKLSETPYQTEKVQNASLEPGTEKELRAGINGYAYELYKKIYEGNAEKERKLVGVSEYKPLNRRIEVNES